MTFSISARCAATGQFGVAVTSSSPAVAARCAHVRAGTGAVASQNVTDPRLGPAALDLLARGATAAEAIEALTGSREHMGYRQLLVVDGTGRPAVWNGDRVLGLHASALGQECGAAGNLLGNTHVPAAMVACFEGTEGDLGERLLAALAAGLAAGGEAGPVRSAGLLVAAPQVPWPVTDLRVDWDLADPIASLRELYALWQPQRDAYVGRAFNPDDAPAFGVPGNE